MPTYYDKETGISFVYGRRDDPQKIFKTMKKKKDQAEKAAGGKFTVNIGDVKESESQDSHFKGQKYQGKK